MKVLMICDEYPPGRSAGIGSFVRSAARQMVSLGHTVYVAGLYPHDYSAPDFQIDEGVTVLRFRYGLNARNFQPWYKLMRRLPYSARKAFFSIQALQNFYDNIQSLIEQEGFDIIEVPDWNDYLFHTGWHRLWPKLSIPLVLKLHGSHSYFANETGKEIIPELFSADVALYRRADAVASVSRYTAEKTADYYHTRRTTAVLYNGVEISEPDMSLKKDMHVIFTGSLTEKKGIHVLMKAWNRVVREVPDARLTVCGKGKISAYSSMLLADVRHSVEFTGHIDQTLLRRRLSTSAIGCFPSFSETFGLSAVEAMMHGCAVIYGDCGPAREIVDDNVDGMLVEPGNEQALADRLIYLLRDGDAARRMGAAAHEKARDKFSIVRCVEDNIAFYEMVIKAGRIE